MSHNCTLIKTPQQISKVFGHLLLTLSLSILFQNAQSQSWQYGDVLHQHGLSSPGISISKVENGGYQIHIQSDRKLFLYELDSSLKLRNTIESREHFSLFSHVLRFVPIEDGWLEFIINRTTLARSTILAVSNRKNSSDTIQLAEIQNSFVYESAIRFSRSNGEYLLWFEWQRSPRVDPEEVSVVHYNPSTHKVTVDSIFPGYSNELLSYQRCWQDEESIYLLGRLYDISPVEKRAGKPNYRYCLTQHHKKTGSTNTTFLTSGTSYDQKLQIAKTGDGFLYSVFTGKKPKLCDTINVFHLPKNGDSVTHISSHHIDLPKHLRSSLTYRRLKKSVKNLWVDDFEIDSSENLGIWMEFYSRKLLQAYVNQQSFKYLYGPILRYDVQSDTIKYFDKLQASYNDDGQFSSYDLVHMPNQTCIIMNRIHHPERKRNILGNHRLLSHRSDLVIFPTDAPSKVYQLRDNKSDRYMPILQSISWETDQTFVVLMIQRNSILPARCTLNFTP